MEPTRRLLLSGIGAVLAAPAIVRATSIMQIKPEFPSGLIIKAYEHVHPASMGVPQSGWVNFDGLPLAGRPHMVWTWDQFLRELTKPNPHPALVAPPFSARPWDHRLAFDVAPSLGQLPGWVGRYLDPSQTS